MTKEQKEKAIAAFSAKPKREQIKMLEVLSKPWIEQGAIKCNAKSLEEIIVLQELSEGAKVIAEKKTEQLFKIMGRRAGTGTTMGGSNNLKPKRSRLKRRK